MKRIATTTIGLGLLLAACGTQPSINPSPNNQQTFETNLQTARIQSVNIQEPHNPKNIVVGYVNEDDLANIAQSLGGTVQAKISQLRAALIKLPNGLTPSRALGTLNVKPVAGMRYSHANYVRALPKPVQSEARAKTLAVNDPLQGQKYDHKLMRAQEAWDTEVEPGVKPSGDGVVIAIMDTGIDGTHPDLAGKFVTGFNAWTAAGNAGCASTPVIIPPGFDATNGIDDHGTHVAGISAAISDNSQGIAGIASKAKLMDLKVFCGGSTDDFTLALAIVGAMFDLDGDGITPDVVNLSLGGKGYGQIMVDAVNTAASGFDLMSGPLASGTSGTPLPGYGTVGRTLPLLVAMGNSSQDELEYPAGYPSVIAIGATNGQDQKASFSTSGSHIAVAAPGEGILSTVPLWLRQTTGQPYLHQLFNGTSMATPQATGAVALIKQFFPLATVHQVRRLLQITAKDIDASGFDRATGAGRIDLKALVDLLANIKAGNAQLPDMGGNLAVAVGTSKNAIALEDVDIQLIQNGVVKYISKTTCYVCTDLTSRIALAGFVDIAPGTYDIRVAGQDATGQFITNLADRISATKTETLASSQDKTVALTLKSTLEVKLEWTGGGDLDLAIGHVFPDMNTVKSNPAAEGTFTPDDLGSSTTTASETYVLNDEHNSSLEHDGLSAFSIDSTNVTDGSSKTAFITVTRNGISKKFGPIIVRGGQTGLDNIQDIFGKYLPNPIVDGLIAVY
jgi:subtilisin family serine protease